MNDIELQAFKDAHPEYILTCRHPDYGICAILWPLNKEGYLGGAAICLGLSLSEPPVRCYFFDWACDATYSYVRLGNCDNGHLPGNWSRCVDASGNEYLNPYYKPEPDTQSSMLVPSYFHHN